jgi:hypothetical protein
MTQSGLAHDLTQPHGLMMKIITGYLVEWLTQLHANPVLRFRKRPKYLFSIFYFNIFVLVVAAEC